MLARSRERMIGGPGGGGKPAVKPQMDDSWLEAVGDELETPAMQGLRSFLAAENRRRAGLLPPRSTGVHRAPTDTARRVRVVILGQDPTTAAGRRWDSRSPCLEA